MAKISKFIFWTPRILSIIFILFLAMFSLDVFGNGYTFWQTVLGLFMHNLPVFILTALLIIAWKHEIVGAIAFFVAGLLYIFLTSINLLKGPFEWYYLAWIIQIAGPALLIGILFLINWKQKKRIKKRKNK